MFLKMQNSSPFFLFEISKQGIVFFKNAKLGMLTHKKIEFWHLNQMELYENLHATI